MTPQDTSWSLNIDTMLQHLEQQQPSKTVSPASSSQDIPHSNPLSRLWGLSPKVALSKLSPWGKKILSWSLTLMVLVIGAWVLSVQYPQETSALMQGGKGTFLKLAGVVATNQTPDKIVSATWDVVVEDYETSTPLSDALENAQQTSWQNNKADEILWEVLSWSNSNAIEFGSGSSNEPSTWSSNEDSTWSSSWTQSETEITVKEPSSTYEPKFDLPQKPLPELVEFAWYLGDLDKNALEAMDNYLGLSDSDRTKLRMISKNMKDTLSNLRKKRKVVQTDFDFYTTMNDMYKKIMDS